VRFSIDGRVVDFFDNDGHNAVRNRPFQNGPVSGSKFVMELTRVTTGGPRIAEIDAILADGWPPLSLEWFGQSLRTTIAVVGPGDADMDGDVDDADATILATNWQASGNVGWSQGDFNADGVVDEADAAILSANWQAGAPNTAGTPVPEPSTSSAMLAVGLAALILRLRAKASLQASP
jgi:hypothetical protein